MDPASRFADILDPVQNLLHRVLFLMLLGHLPLQEIGRRVVLLLDRQAHQRIDLAGDELLMFGDRWNNSLIDLNFVDGVLIVPIMGSTPVS